MHVGDEPAQRRHCGLMEGGAKHFCTLCTHAAGTRYNPKKTSLRDYSTINKLWDNFHKLDESRRGDTTFRNKKTDEEIELRSTFNELSVSHMKSPFADAPLGVKNNVFTSIRTTIYSLAVILRVLIMVILLLGAPYCRLHTIDGGVMKNAVINIMIIIERISKVDSFQGAPGLLDERLASMTFVPQTAHLKWPVFPDGLFQYVKSKSAKEKGLSGGSFGRLRSSWFPDILLQLHFAIDYDGKILPATDTFQYTARNSSLGGKNKGAVRSVVVKGKKKEAARCLIVKGKSKNAVNSGSVEGRSKDAVESVTIGNVTKIVQRAILALLDFFYSICREEFNPQDIEAIEKLSLHAYEQFQDLDHLKRELLFESRGNMMRKTHYLFHTGYWIRLFGSLSQFNTESFEAAHRAFTTGNYERTSKRSSTMNEEMHLQSLRDKHVQLVNFRSKIISDDGRKEYEIKHGPKIFPDADLELFRVSNTREVALKRSGNTFQFADEKVICPFHPNTDLQNIATLVKDVVCNKSDKKWRAKIYGVDGSGYKKVSILYGVTYKTSRDRGVGAGHLYAHHAYGGSVNKRPRYDFILIDYGGEEIPAQIIALVQIDNTERRQLKFYGVCLYLKNDADRDARKEASKKGQKKFAGLRIPFQQYQYHCPSKDYVKDLVCLDEQMLRPAIVIPRFSMSTCVHGKPSMADRFLLIDLKYIDRSGWTELIGGDIEVRLQMERERVIVDVEGGVASSRQEYEDYVEGEDEEEDDEEENGNNDDGGAGGGEARVLLLGEEGAGEEGGTKEDDDDAY